MAAIAAGTYATGALSVRLGGSPWLGLVFTLAPATMLTLLLSLADSLALAAVIAFLLSPDARAITGACIPVAGRV